MIRYERDDRGDLWAVTDVPVGIGRIPFRVPLGPWDRDDPGPGGLLQLPVVVLSRQSLGDVAHAAVSRSGRVTAIDVSPAGHELLSVAEGGAEVLVVGDGDGRSMNVIRALGGRPLPALAGQAPTPLPRGSGRRGGYRK